VNLPPSVVRKYTRFPKSGSVLGGLDIKEATLDMENGTWFVMFSGKVSRSKARKAMSHFIDRTATVPTNTRSFSSPRVVPVKLMCDEVTTVRSNPSGRVTIAKGHLSFDGVLKNPVSVSEFTKEMNDMVTHNPHKVFREFPYKRLNDKKFLDQLWSFVSFSGESYGWATSNGKVFHRRASLIMPKIKINKRPDNEVAFYHTHPSKDEPSLTSADDIQFYSDLAFAPGVKHNYTVMRDRIDYFRFDVKKKKVDEYLDIDEGHFIDDVDAMIEQAEMKYKDDDSLGPVEYCNLVTAEMVRMFNDKYKGLMKITYQHFVNPKYKKGDEGPLANPLPNPTSPVIPEKYHHHSLTDLQGLDYSWVHYGGDEFAHTLYVHYWLKHHFEPDSKGVSRIRKLEPLGFDSELRKKTRAYLNQRITANWSFLDLLYTVALYHDIGKVREKDGEHHSLEGKYMWDEFIADALDVPHAFEEVVSLMLESDIGRRNISDDFFQTQVGEYYGVALIMQMADIVTHHPHMFTGYAKQARKSGQFKGDVRAYKEWAMSGLVEKLKKFLEKPLPNPRPSMMFINWQGDYGTKEISSALVGASFEQFTDNLDGVFRARQGGSTAYFKFNTDTLPALTGMIPDGVDVSVRLIPATSSLWVSIKREHQVDDFGAEVAQTIYEEVGEILKGFDDRIVIDKVEAAIRINPRKAKKVGLVIVSGPTGSGKSTLIRHMTEKFEVAGEPIKVTSRPRRSREKDGVDAIFTSKAEFEQMIESDQFVEWALRENGHYYGRRWVDFNYPVNVISADLKGVKAYKKVFPQAYTIFLKPDVSGKEMVQRIMRRGGMSLEEAKKQAEEGAAQVAEAKSIPFDQFVTVKSGSYEQLFDKMAKSMGNILTNPRVHESKILAVVEPALNEMSEFERHTRKNEFYNRKMGTVPFNMLETLLERDNQAYEEKRQRLIEWNQQVIRTTDAGTHVAFVTSPDNRPLPEGSTLSPKTRADLRSPKTKVIPPPLQALVPVEGVAELEAKESQFSLDAFISNPPEGLRLKDVTLSADYKALLDDIAWRFAGMPPANFNVSKATQKQKDVLARRKKRFRELLAGWGYTGVSPAKAAEHIFQEHLKKFRGERVKVYRAMFTSEPPEILDDLWNKYGVGVYWSNARGGADQFGGAQSRQFKFHPSSRIAFLMGTVPFGDVNWFGTLQANVMFGIAESEVRMFSDSTVKVDKVEFYKLDQKAREKYLGLEGLGGRYQKPWTDPAVKPVDVWNVNESYFAFVSPKESFDDDDEFENPKDLFDWFEEWVHLINMKNKELKAFLDSPLGKKAGLSKQQAKDWNNIKSGRVSGRRILKMRAKLGLTGPKDYIKPGPRIIENYYEKALSKWTGPSDDPLKGETDWDWCKRQVRFVKRTSAFPYNPNAEERKGPLVRAQKTQSKPSRRLLSLWVWGHDPWRWARKNGYERMSPCPDVPWVGMTEKRKWGKTEVKMNPPDEPEKGFDWPPPRGLRFGQELVQLRTGRRFRYIDSQVREVTLRGKKIAKVLHKIENIKDGSRGFVTDEFLRDNYSTIIHPDFRANPTSDDEHQETLGKTGFWGKQGAGSLVVAKKTGRYLLPLRSQHVEQPGTWGVWGGAIDSGEVPVEAARRELTEEAGYRGPIEMVPLVVFESGTFRYHNFLAVVEDEFEPTLNWETEKAQWFALDDFPQPLHYGLQYLLENSEVRPNPWFPSDASYAPGLTDQTISITQLSNPSKPVPLPLKKGITIYGEEYCKWCKEAKKLVEKKNLKHRYVDIQKVSGYQEKIGPLTENYQFIPAIFVDGKFIGGFSDLKPRLEPHPEKITPAHVRSRPDTLFVFGDNDQRKGKKGQAIIRDEPNAIGFRTKKSPSRFASAYYTDDEYSENIRKMKEDLEEISARSLKFDNVYFIPGIGEGLAKLEEKAPRTYAWMKKNLPTNPLEDEIKELRSEIVDYFKMWVKISQVHPQVGLNSLDTEPSNSNQRKHLRLAKKLVALVDKHGYEDFKSAFNDGMKSIELPTHVNTTLTRDVRFRIIGPFGEEGTEDYQTDEEGTQWIDATEWYDEGTLNPSDPVWLYRESGKGQWEYYEPEVLRPITLKRFPKPVRTAHFDPVAPNPPSPFLKIPAEKVRDYYAEALPRPLLMKTNVSTRMGQSMEEIEGKMFPDVQYEAYKVARGDLPFFEQYRPLVAETKEYLERVHGVGIEVVFVQEEMNEVNIERMGFRWSPIGNIYFREMGDDFGGDDPFEPGLPIKVTPFVLFDSGFMDSMANPRTPGGKKFPKRYLTGLTKLEKMIAEDEIDKGYKYDVNDPEAYKFWKSDIKATARGLKIGPSKHKEKYYRLYRKNIDKDYKPSGSSSKQKFLNRIRKETGIKKSILEKIYDKGLAAWRVGHRPGVQQHQWAAGRVYAFVVGADSSTGPGKPDNKLAVEAGVR